ncbi:MAG: hypothetical protein JWO91_2969 [Acidobacteriaceae bacterium]|jgi:hypothetical protein|nr:hypothetical protein [Acidobacteriaceae bacterium]
MASNSRKKVLPIISLDDEETARSIFRKLNHTSAAYKVLRRKVFEQVARNAKLQQLILEVLSSHIGLQKKILLGVAENPTLRRELLKIAGVQRSVFPDT